MNIEQVVAEMPKVSINSISEDEQVEFGIYPHAVEIIVEAQCQLLAEHGWRKVPSLESMTVKLRVLNLRASLISTTHKEGEFDSSVFIAQELHRWLLEGE